MKASELRKNVENFKQQTTDAKNKLIQTFIEREIILLEKQMVEASVNGGTSLRFTIYPNNDSCMVGKWKGVLQHFIEDEYNVEIGYWRLHSRLIKINNPNEINWGVMKLDVVISW